ncbi:manganese efflux pump MntP family protein [Candidatus Aminicenantes bacterium AH-873-B07]|nr:manganese efflux pump MntP family protein [Candidatus Aminicenantes bacterium AH-873-B07]
MDLFTCIFIGIGLAMDASAVSLSKGFTMKSLNLNNIIKISFLFGSFQAFMPLIGWFIGINLIHLISGLDHWIAFGLLNFIGFKMVYHSIKKNIKEKDSNHFNFKILLILALATSIDAFAVGLSLSFLRISIILPILIIGIITFIFSFISVLIGYKLGHFLEKEVEMLGGLILIGIGIKILLEHLF